MLNRLDLSEVLVELVTDRRSTEYRDGLGRTALHLVASRQFDLIEHMIEFGHDVDSYDDEGMTPLSLAASSGYADADLSVEVLIGSGAYVDSVDIYGWTPLMHAARGASWLNFELLLDYGADPYAQDGNGQSVLCHAGAGGDLVIVDALVELGVDIDLGGPLVQAAFHGRLGAAKLLYNAGADALLEAPVFSGTGDRYEFLGSFHAIDAAASNDDRELMELFSNR